MNKRTTYSPDKENRLFTRDDLCAYLKMGQGASVAFAEQCGARRKIGKSVRFDKKVIDQALDSMHDV